MRIVFILLLAMLLCGCGGGETAAPSESRIKDGGFYVQSLAVQQSQVYEETITGRFVSLADFEDSATWGGESGAAQLAYFTVNPLGEGEMRHVANITRTGAGAMEALLEPGGSLVFRSPHVRDWRGYTLLSMAIYSESVRDDLTVSLAGPAATWTSPPQLLPTGWSTVKIDLARLENRGAFDLRQVDGVEISLSAADEPVRLNIDDIMLIDNTRVIPDTPQGITLRKTGLDYSMTLPGWNEVIAISQGDDGLWRLGGWQPRVELLENELSGAGEAAERLDLMGGRRVGAVELIEVNPVRLRLRNTWYFPPQAGEWLDMDVPQIRWEYTFYGDGRWVTAMTLNNAGGEPISALRVTLPVSVAWSDGKISDRLELPHFSASAGMWAFLAAPNTRDGTLQKLNYAAPAAAVLRLGDARTAEGDLGGDGFDESQGCYFAGSSGGNCRLEFQPNRTALVRPVIVVAGQWKQAPAVNCQGLAVREVSLHEGRAIAILPEVLTSETLVEFAGEVGLLED